MDTGNIAVILSLGVVAPTWIVFHYLTRWRGTKTISGEDEKLLQDLWQSAEKIEKRLGSLEKILDAESPNWWRGRDDYRRARSPHPSLQESQEGQGLRGLCRDRGLARGQSDAVLGDIRRQSDHAILASFACRLLLGSVDPRRYAD